MKQWTKPLYKSGEIDKAGAVLVGRVHPDVADEELEAAYIILDNFRSAHAFPLNTFQMGLRKKSRRVDGESLVAQRIKRLSSIEAKLIRFPTLRLSQMQDIGGCRAVVSTVPQVERLVAEWKRSEIRHELVGEKDYIKTPDESGYRSVISYTAT